MAGLRFSLRFILLAMLIVALSGSHLWTSYRLHETRGQLLALRKRAGYLTPHDQSQVAAVRIPSSEILTWRFRVFIPPGTAGRLRYSTYWPADAAEAEWYAAQPLPPGESEVIVKVAEDPRDKNWKIATIVRNRENTLRMQTALPEQHVEKFRTAHTVFNGGVSGKQVEVAPGETLVLVDDRWPDGEGRTLLYGAAPPQQPLVGVFVRLETD